MFKRILIANRGEVVQRVLKTTQRLGIEVVVVVSEADRDAPYTRLADEVVCIGPAPSGKSYLRRGAVIQAALQTGATAIHPGWGFLSEDPLFVELCTQHGLSFIGPSARVMRLMGRKLQAKQAARSAGLEVIPGSLGLVGSVEEARTLAAEVGYPVILKADAGGGGRGMRFCDDESGLADAFNMASAEAQAAFGNGSLYLERYLAGGRHIEVQVLGDNYGNAIHLGARECSIQRNHQKLLEESPSPALSPDEARAAGERSAKAAAALGYAGAGTIEYLLDEEGVLRFMEMNARLQVEHPVSELRTGIDLVEQQLRVAAQEPLGITQAEVEFSGHAIEIRLNAEDPSEGFRPSPGTLRNLRWPTGVRVDTHVEDGYTVPPHYDSLIAKLIAHAPDRASCIAKLQTALGELNVEGIQTTAPLHQAVLAAPAFVAGDYDTRAIPGWTE
ncbi:MAG: acetyl-CoA carboxylase biotin carboxylase subunit [Planctomycetes bacterium]|nr:acetyl-CoA carboxylase biotin carboxylase subunit [Planctomycetota bacterium]